jgi:hypothetical protein
MSSTGLGSLPSPEAELWRESHAHGAASDGPLNMVFREVRETSWGNEEEGKCMAAASAHFGGSIRRTPSNLVKTGPPGARTSSANGSLEDRMDQVATTQREGLGTPDPALAQWEPEPFPTSLQAAPRRRLRSGPGALSERTRILEVP